MLTLIGFSIIRPTREHKNCCKLPKTSPHFTLALDLFLEEISHEQCRKQHFRASRFSKFSGGGMPPTPLEVRAFGAGKTCLVKLCLAVALCGNGFDGGKGGGGWQFFPTEF